MSGSSWFDLSSIQEQINKSLQEAAKIAEDASKYDILNFDEMAKREGEEEEEEVDEEKEDDFRAKKHYSSGFSHDFGGYDDVIFGESGIESANILKDSRHYIDEHLVEHDSIHCQPRKSRPEEELRRNLECLLESENLGQLQFPQDRGTADYSSPLRDKRNSNFMVDSKATTLSHNFDSTSAEASGYDSQLTDTPGGVEFGIIHEDINTVNVSGSIEQESVDDFFGEQFSAIITIKAEKTRCSVQADVSSVTEMSQENLSNPKIEAKVFIAADVSSRENHLVPLSKYKPPSHQSVQSVSKNKSNRKKKNKGGLDFFGMGGDEAAADLVNSSGEQSDFSGKIAPDTTYSFFEPVGMLNEDEVECRKTANNQTGQKDSRHTQSQSLGSNDTSINRLPQRLPGIIFPSVDARNVNNDSMSSMGAAAGKALFSFFDNVEDEIDSNEDPILRQVALNISNPRPKGWTQIHSNSVAAFGISPSSSSGLSRGDGDIENNCAVNYSSSTPQREAEDAPQSNMSSSYFSIFETFIIFSRGLFGCVATACSEACNDVGAPLGYRTDLASRLRRGEAVPVTVPSSSSDGIANGNRTQLLLTLSSTLRDPQARQLRIVQVRALLLVVWEHVSSVTGLSVLTMILFAFSYFKFARYGTDSGD